MKPLLSILFLLFFISPAFACTCMNMRNLTVKEHNKYLKEVSSIFEGEVMSLGEKRTVLRKYSEKLTLQETVQSVTFRVYRLWKGQEQTEVTVETDAESSCRFLPPVGSRVTVYAGRARDKTGFLSINQCSVGSFDDQKMRVKYGEGKVIEQQPLPDKDREPESFLSMVWTRVDRFLS